MSDIDRCISAIDRCEKTMKEIRTQGMQLDQRIQTNLNRISASLGRSTSSSPTGHRIMDPLTVSRFAMRRVNNHLKSAHLHLENALDAMHG